MHIGHVCRNIFKTLGMISYLAQKNEDLQKKKKKKDCDQETLTRAGLWMLAEYGSD